MLRRTPRAALRRTPVALVNELDVPLEWKHRRYADECFRATEAMKNSRTYPGSIKAATPGHTRHFWAEPNSFVNVVKDDHGFNRFYWRAVVDDAEVKESVQVRIRFKEDVFVPPDWECRSHVIVVHVPPASSIADVITEVNFTNESPYVGQSSYDLAADGKTLDETATLDELFADKIRARRGITLDAIEVARDHRYHEPGVRPRDLSTHDVPPAELEAAPYAELALFLDPSLTGDAGGKGLRYGTKPPARGLSKYGAGAQALR